MPQLNCYILPVGNKVFKDEFMNTLRKNKALSLKQAKVKQQIFAKEFPDMDFRVFEKKTHREISNF